MLRILHLVTFSILGLSSLLLSTGYVAAQSAPKTANANAAEALEVTADHSLEWYQEKQLYVARGNAKAVKGDMVLQAETLTARRRETGQKQPASGKAAKAGRTGDIDLITAEGNVRISDPRQKLFGDKGVYDVSRGIAVLTGQNLRYETERDVVTARDSLEYWEESRQAIARGKAVATGRDRRVEADVLTARFKENGGAGKSTGDMVLSELTADGHVVVITKGDVARGDHGVYDMERNVATLTGHVMITRADGTQLSGNSGEVDFTTNQSRLLSGGKGGRVRVLLPAQGGGK